MFHGPIGNCAARRMLCVPQINGNAVFRMNRPPNVFPSEARICLDKYDMHSDLRRVLSPSVFRALRGGAVLRNNALQVVASDAAHLSVATSRPVLEPSRRDPYTWTQDSQLSQLHGQSTSCCAIPRNRTRCKPDSVFVPG
jgi:hypothetical protein